MSFLENLGKTISDVAQSAAKKSGEMVETTKLNMSIGAEEEKIDKIQSQMGKKLYESYAAGTKIVIDDFKDACSEIKERNEIIKELKSKIMDARNMRICASCGTELDKTVQFCNKCGAKQEVAEPAAPAQEEKLCPKCKAQITDDSGFCSACGEKLK